MKRSFTQLISEVSKAKQFTFATATLLLLIISAAYLRAAVGITVTGSNPITVSADLAKNSLTPTGGLYTSLGTITIAEPLNSTNDFGSSNTIEINAPIGWEFNIEGVYPYGVSVLGREVSNTTKIVSTNLISVTTSKVTFTYSGAAFNKNEEFLISGIKIRAIDGSSAPENVNVTVSSTTSISGLPATAVTINHVHGAAKKIAFGQQPTNVLTSNLIAPSVTVIAQDQFNNTVTSGTGSSASINLSIGNNPAGSNGVLSGGGPVAAVNGVATFSGLSIDAAGSGYTLVASSGSLTSITSSAFNVASKTPTLAAMPANCITEGSGDYTITLTGTNFEKNSVGQVNGVNRATTFVSATQLQVVLLASDLATAGNISITVLNPAPPSSNISNAQILNVKPSFSNATIAGDRTVCAGKNVLFTAPAGFTDYTWSATAGSGTFSATGNANETNFTPGIDASGVVTITASAKNACGVSGTVTFDIDVLPAPQATITYTGSTAICEGSSIVLNAPSAPSGETYTYQWFNGSTPVGVNTETYTATSAGDYTVTVTATNGCPRTSAPVAVTVNPLPVATITASGPTTFCQGGSVTLTANDGDSWLWSNGATTQSITVDANGTFTVQVTDGNSCTSPTSEAVVVAVNPIPDAPAVTGGAVCDQGEVTLSATVGTNGTEVRWYTAATGGSPVATGNSYTTPTLTATTTFYASSYNTTTDCESERVAVVATVNPLPTVSITPTGPLQFCEGNSVVLVPTALPTGDTFTYAWFNAAGNSEVGTSKDYVATTSGDYYLVVTNQNGCQQTSETLTVIVAEIPTEANITLTGSSTFCQGGSVKLSANKSPDAENPYTYKWFKNDVEIADATSEIYTATESGDYQVEVTNLVEDCSKMSAKVKVTVLPQPVSAITSSNEAKCLGAGNTTTFSVTGDFSGGTAQWLSSNSSFVISNAVYNPSTGKATATVTATGTGSSTITLRTTNTASSCTTANSTVSLTVNPLPTADITAGGATTFCQGGSVVLSAPANANYTYQWFRNNSAIPSGGTDRQFTATIAGDYTVRVTNSATGCVTTTATATTIVVNPQPTVTASAPVLAKCVGDNNTTVFDLTGTATNGTPKWSVVSSTGSATLSSFSSPTTGNTQVTIAGIGTVTVRLTSSSTVASCTDATKDITLTVNPYPTANAGPDQALCAGATSTRFWRQASGTGSEAGTEVKWTVKSTDPGVSVTNLAYPWIYNNFVDITGVGKATLLLTVTTNGCTTTDEVIYTVKPTPVITAIANKTYCDGEPANAINFESSVAGSALTWTSSVNIGFGTSGTGNIPAYTATNTGTSTISTTVTVNASVNGCSASQKTFTVTVYPTPKLSSSLTPAAICSGATFNYNPTGATAGATYSWSRAAVTGISNAAATGTGAISEVLVNATTTDKVVTYTYTIAANGCSNTQNVAVTVKAKPQPTFSGLTDNQVVYSGEGVKTLSGTPAGGTFSGPGISGNTFNPCNVFNGVPESTTTLPVTIKYSVTANGCTGEVTKTIIVKRSTYRAVILANPHPFCRGMQVTYTTTIYRDLEEGDVIYPYLVDANGQPVYSNGGAVPTGSSSFPEANMAYPFPANTPQSIKNLAYRFFQPIVKPGLESKVVTVVDNGDVYQWGKNHEVNRKNDKYYTTDAGLSSQDYYHVYVKLTQCGTVLPILQSNRMYSAELPGYEASLTAVPNPICQNGSVTFTATLNSAFDWATANTTVEFVLSRGDVVLGSQPFNGSYTYTITSSGPAGGFVNGDQVYLRFMTDIEKNQINKCRDNNRSNTVTINVVVPQAMTGGGAYCAGGAGVPVGLASSQQGVSYQLLHNGNPVGSPVAGTGSAISFGNQTAAGVYTVRPTTASGSTCADFGTINVYVTPLPTVFNVTGGGELCAGGTGVPLGLSGSQTGVSYQLLLNNVAVGTAVAGTGAALSFGNKTAAGTYTITATTISNTTSTPPVAACPQPMTGSVAVVVNPLPTVTVNSPTVCSGQIATVIATPANGTGPYTFTWTVPGGVTNPGNVASFQTTVAGNYTVRVTDSKSCASSAVATSVVTINPLPTVTVSSPTTCQGTAVMVAATATGTGPFNYAWTVPGGVANPGNVANFTTTVAGNYAVVVTDSRSCASASGSGTVTVTPIKVATGFVSADKDPIKLNEPVTFTLTHDIISTDVRLITWYVRSVGSTSWGTAVASGMQPTYTMTPTTDEPFEVRAVVTTPAEACYSFTEFFTDEPIVPLPVELLYFKAVKKDKAVVLTWATASERDNAGFEVQVSQDGKTYKQLQFVPTNNGNSSIKQTYEFVDKENGKYGTRYYRLKQLDTDGMFAYYGPQMVTFGEVSNNVLVYPNPFEREVKLDVDAEKDGVMEVTLTNMMGKQLLIKQMEVAKGQSTATLDLGENLAPGVYIITTRLNGLTFNTKLLKR